MKAKIHNKNTLDRVGKELIRRDVVSAEEIERIVSNPYLFSRITAQLESEKKPVIGRSPLFVRYAAAGAGMLVVAIAFVATAVSLRSVKEVSHVIEVQAPAEMPATVRPANLPPLRAGSNPTSGRTAHYEAEPASTERTVVKTVYNKPSTKREPSIDESDMPEFIPVAYAGDPRETAGAHIVRVDMPRSSLFALGINVPLENDSDTVRADVLVGADGVTRAIRVLK